MENLSYILYCLAGIGWSFVIKFFFPKLRNGSVIFSAFGSMAIFMYIFSFLLGLHFVASYAIVYMGILAIIVSIVLNNKYKRFRYKSLLSYSTILFVLGITYLYFALRDYEIYSHDSYSHWGTIVKQLYYSTKAFPNFDSVSAHNNYPIIFSMAQYTMMSLIGYKESLLYLTISLYKLVILIGILDTLPKKTLIGNIIFTFLVLLTYPLGDTALAIDTLVAGTFLGTLPVYFLFLWFTRPEKLNIEFMLPIFVCLALMPSAKIISGFAFSLVCVIIIAIAVIKAYKNKNEDKKIYLRVLIISFIVVIISHCSFYTYYNINLHSVQKEYQERYASVTGESVDYITVDSFKLKDLFVGDNITSGIIAEAPIITTQFKIKIIKSTIKEFLFAKFDYAEFKSFSYPEMLFLMFALNMSAYIIAQKNTRKRYNKILLSICAFSIIYVLGLIYMYIFQANAVTELHRYFSVLLIMYSISIAFFVGETLSNVDSKKQVKLLSVIMAFSLTIVFAFNYAIFTKSYTKDKENNRTLDENYTRKKVEEIKGSFQNGDRILIIDCTCEGNSLTSMIRYSYIYEMLPYYSVSVLLNDKPRYGEYTLEDIDNLVFINLVNKVVILNPDENFIQRFGAQFENAKDMDVYEVMHIKGIMCYRKIR